MRDLTIVGSSPKAHSHPFYKYNVDKQAFESDSDIWTFNSFVQQIPKVDATFQIHLPKRYKNQPRSWEWLKSNTTIPVYMREKDPEVPMSIAYPFEEAFDLVKNVKYHGKDINLFTSSLPFAIALAILQKREKISFYGIELLIKSEYEDQRPGILFWQGVAAGHGLNLEINCMDQIFSHEIYCMPSDRRLKDEMDKSK